MYACNGILFNHESPIRGETFVTRKITRAVARIKRGCKKHYGLATSMLNATGDMPAITFRAMWRMLQQEVADDFVIATGEVHSVREFIEAAFAEVGISITWHGEGIDETGVDAATGETLVAVDPRYFRPTEVEFLQGDATKAKQKLGWTPKTSFAELVKMMVVEDLKTAQRDQLCEQHGYRINGGYED